MTLTFGFYIDSVAFTPEVIAGTASLGGSESACLGLARALKARGHTVVIFATQLHDEAPAIDHAGVQWAHANEIDGMSRVVDWDVFVALRMPHCFTLPIRAKYRILWNQDLMTGDDAKNITMALSWAYDAVAYVSAYHRKQWEGQIPELAPIGWVTKNGFDPQHVPKDAVKDPNRIIHITRPERGLRPILAMWPELKRRYPQATLSLCRYNSMYDAQGWAKVCASYDDAVKAVNEQVGGITYLGELGKADLYQAIAESAVMWYPGVVDFAETSCIAAIEAQACGTPFVGSWKGALPETVPSGLLIEGDADRDPEYAEASISAVIEQLQGCATQSFAYRSRVKQGLAHVSPGYSYDTIAQEWEAHLFAEFDRRVATKGRQVLERLLHEDDHVAAQAMARQLMDREILAGRWPEGADVDQMSPEHRALFETWNFCQHVIDGKEHTAADYAEYALDPLEEIKVNGRIPQVSEQLRGATHILDLACGNGSMAISIVQANPGARVLGIDYAQRNIDAATEAARILGVSDRCTFVCAPVYDFATHQIDPGLAAIVAGFPAFDGVFIGEFLEHIANVDGFLNALHPLVAPGARVVCTMPSGPYCELNARDVPYKRGHVHHFRPRDLQALFGQQANVSTSYLEAGLSMRWSVLGTWIVAYNTSAQPIGARPLTETIRTARPFSKLSVGIIAGEATDLRRCLQSVWGITDEIVIGDTGCKPAELAQVLAEFPKTRAIPIGPVDHLRGGFSEARNMVLSACTGEWFFWIDTDEVLVRPEALHRYLEATTFHGYAVKQNHLMLDMPKSFDTPVRIFRRSAAIRFYGCIHEQPQMGDCNGDIVPSLQLADAEIAHVLGYLTEDIRRRKCLQRNLPLLARDQDIFPDRRLGKVLVIRDMLNLAQWETEEAGGRLTARAKERLGTAIALFEKHFSDPADKYHTLARPFYEAALKHVAGSLECEFSFVAQVNGLKGRPKPERVWVRTQAQLDALLKLRVEQWTKPMQPAVIDVEPMVARVVDMPEGAPV